MPHLLLSIFGVFSVLGVLEIYTVHYGQDLSSSIVLCSNWALSIWKLMSFRARKFSLLLTYPFPYPTVSCRSLLVGSWTSWPSPLLFLFVFFPSYSFCLIVRDFINVTIQSFCWILECASCFYLLRASHGLFSFFIIIFFWVFFGHSRGILCLVC